jgi:hypothetical protein
MDRAPRRAVGDGGAEQARRIEQVADRPAALALTSAQIGIGPLGSGARATTTGFAFPATPSAAVGLDFDAVRAMAGFTGAGDRAGAGFAAAEARAAGGFAVAFG